MSNDLQIFNNNEFGEIRVIEIDNEPWFVGKDVVKDLGYEISKTMSYTYYINKYCSEDDIKKVNNCDAQLFGIEDAGRKGELLINEYALYDLTFESPLPSAKEFKYWVTHEVLPSIRKHGAYMTDNVLEQAISDPDFLIGLLQNLKEEKEKRKLAEERNKELNKEIDHKENVIIGLVDDISLAEKRARIKQVINHNANGRYAERYNLLYKEFQDKYHIDLKRRMNNLEIKSIVTNHLGEEIKITKKIKTNKMEYIDKILCKTPELYEIVCKLFENDVNELMKEWKDTII